MIQGGQGLGNACNKAIGILQGIRGRARPGSMFPALDITVSRPFKGFELS